MTLDAGLSSRSVRFVTICAECSAEPECGRNNAAEAAGVASDVESPGSSQHWSGGSSHYAGSVRSAPGDEPVSAFTTRLRWLGE